MSNALTTEERKEYKKQWYKANQERLKLKAKEYRAENPEIAKEYNERNKDKIKVIKKNYYDRNSEDIKKRRNEDYATKGKVWNTRQEYVKNNLDKFSAYRSKRRAKEKDQLHVDHNHDIEKVLRQTANRMKDCLGIQFNVDHILPIQHGGWHHHLNMQILPESTNQSKGDSLTWNDPSWMTWRDPSSVFNPQIV